MQKRKCYKCGIEKPYSSFKKDKSRHDGLQAFCNDCHSLYVIEHRARIRGNLCTGLVCVVCNKEIDRPHFHHIDPSQKEFAIGALISATRGVDFLSKEIAKCVPMHQACHKLVEALIDNPEVESYLNNAKEWANKTRLTKK
jgi:hypothetical protein